MKNICTLFILCVMCSWSYEVNGQDMEVRAELCSDTVMVGQQFTLTYIVDGGQINELNDPDLSAFNLLSGPNMSTSMSFINGQMSAKSSVNFVLQAREPGDFMIDPASLIINGEEVQVESLRIHIVENPDGILPEDLLPHTPGSKKPKKKIKTYKL